MEKKAGFQSVNAASISNREDEYNPFSLPHNLDAEQGVLACVIASNILYDSVSDILKAEHFFIAIHQQIWAEISQKIEKSEKVSILSLSEKFGKAPDLIENGGSQYFMDLGTSWMANNDPRHYAEMVVECYKKRSFYQFSEQLKENSKSEKSENLSLMTDKFLTSVLAEENAEIFSLSDTADLAIRNMEEMKSGKIKPMTTDIQALDKKISGLFGGRLYIIAGRPAMGKTALALTIASNLSNPLNVINSEEKEPFPVLYFSLEMPKEELSMRLIARETGISVERQQSTEQLTKEEWNEIILSKRNMATKKLFIIDKNCNSLPSIRAFSRRFSRSQGKGIIIIDYLGLMDGDKSINNKVHQIEQITTGLKKLSKEINMPIILLCQLSRAVESRDDKRPMLSDLRDSGSIEQDADMVLFCHREEYYLKTKKIIQYPRENQDAFRQRQIAHDYELEQSRGKAEIIVSKYRQGTTGIVKVDFKGVRQEFC